VGCTARGSIPRSFEPPSGGFFNRHAFMTSHETLDDYQVLIPDLLASHARFQPRKEAVICGDVRRSWAEFDANISRVAHALAAQGLGRGDKVAVLMGNSVEILEVVFGIVRAGACAVPLSGLLTGDQLAALISDSGAVAAFATPEFQAKLDSASTAPGCLRAHLKVLHGAPVLPAGWKSLDDFVAHQPTHQPDVRLHQDDPFNIIYSSGTTGLPKGIVQTHRARLHWAFSNAIEMGFRDTSRALTTTSLYSNGTWLMMLPVLFAGGTLVVMPGFDVSRFLALLSEERITHTFLVPSQSLMVLSHPALEGFDRARDAAPLEVILSAGSPLRTETKRELIERFGPRVIELYGFSEGFASMLKPWHPAEKFNTVGTPVMGFEIRILDDEGRELARGEIGEIAAYGAGMMREYHGRPEETARLIWRDERRRTFIRSGDIGRLDADGFLSILDRKKDMIISGGFNVFPADIEQIVASHPAVQDVTVIGIPHERWGETPLALVILHDLQASASAPSKTDLMAWANQRLAKHQRLGALEFRTSFPRNALGKVLKKDLREPYWAGAGRTI
jgi:long-chain acyl-CoA synthetase